jgi:hypothetical protein
VVGGYVWLGWGGVMQSVFGIQDLFRPPGWVWGGRWVEVYCNMCPVFKSTMWKCCCVL